MNRPLSLPKSEKSLGTGKLQQKPHRAFSETNQSSRLRRPPIVPLAHDGMDSPSNDEHAA